MGLERDKEFLTAFGKKLKQVRKEKNISQAQLAFEADVQISQISRIERGLINTTIANAHLLAKILDVPTKSLFDF